MGADADEPKSRRCAARAIYPIRTVRDAPDCAIHIPNCTLRAAGSRTAEGSVSDHDRADAEAPRYAPSAPWAPRCAYAQHASDAPCAPG